MNEEKEKRSADEDLKLLFETGKTLKSNSTAKKELRGKTENKPKSIFNWTLNKRKPSTDEEGVAADSTEEEKTDGADDEAKEEISIDGVLIPADEPETERTIEETAPKKNKRKKKK